MSRLPVTVWPFGTAAAADAHHQFVNERDVRVAAVGTAVGFLPMLAAAMLWSLPASGICVAAAFVGICVVGIWSVKHAEEPSPAVSADRSLGLTRAFWVTELVLGLLLCAAVVVGAT
ncbi:hypothetical protein [Patulibacter minatonensis]|uniref:hypothetical protein n=1 Tax=Patulibacter minatonensis TaxID=298163 RepID=UPI000478C859|nr:hypothetical protein [Patulibacter minatonensis]